MANRRLGLGGMGPPHRGGPNRLGGGGGNFSQHHQPFQGGGVSPWQGGGMSSSAGSNNSNSSSQLSSASLLGQLAANPQQLALALSNLLQQQPQQHHHQQPQQHHQHHLGNPPPSLLTLNTLPAFSRHPSDLLRGGNDNRFGNNQRAGGNNRGADFRRNDNYNKNRGGSGWRQLDNNRHGGGAGGQNRRPGNNQQQKRQSGGSNNNNNQQKRKSDQNNRQRKASEKSDDTKKKDKEKEKDSVVAKGASEKTDDVKAELIDLSVDDARVDDDEGAEETKRGWKEEKNTGDSENNAEEDKDGKEDHGKKSTKREGDDAKKKEGKDGRYGGIPHKLLHCFVCNKDMWDGESFQKHIRGRAHKQMLQSLEDSFHITVNILRENMRVGEEKKVIELNRMHRLNKNKFNRNKFQEPESHCNMCDLKFLGKIISHRKTEGHQRLKRFLHPNCDICHKEFPSRMDWVDHRLTPEHLRSLNDKLEKLGGVDGDAIVDNEPELQLDPLLEDSTEMEDENPIMELSDDLSNLQNRIPTYRKSRAVGKESLKPFTGFMCTICHRSFATAELSEAHLCSKTHYYAFVNAAKLKFKKQQDEAAKKEAESRKRKREEEKQKQAGESAAKKEKIEKKEVVEDEEEEVEEEEEETAESEVKEEQPSKTEAQIKEELNKSLASATNHDEEPDAEMYDPEEACNNEEEAKEPTKEDEVEAEQEEQNEEATTADIKITEVVVQIEKEDFGELESAAEAAAVVVPEAAPVRVTRRTGVGKNGAGPKSKKLAAGKIQEGQAASSPGKPSQPGAFRIPKLGARNAGPK